MPKQERSQLIVDETDAFFRPNGRLAGSGITFEYRPQQHQMALAIANAIAKGQPLAVEAGTGVGKSFAYLVPALIAATEHQERAIVATYTISLQEQIITKDIPFLHKYLGRDFKAVLVKGRNNYLCRRRLLQSLSKGGQLFAPKENEEVATIQDWAENTSSGSLQDLPQQPSTQVWTQVCAEHGNCLGNKCPEKGRCFFLLARRQTQDAHLLIVNHHLYFAELAMRETDASFLPDHEIAIFDEAHEIEDVASDHFGLHLSQYAIEYWLRRLYAPENNRGLLAYGQCDGLCQEVQKLRLATEELFSQITDRLQLANGVQVVTAPLALDTVFPENLGHLCDQLLNYAAGLKNTETRTELESVIKRGREIRETLATFTAQTLPDQVYWVENPGRKRSNLTLRSAPVEVAEILRKQLFATEKSIIMTSATLAVNQNMRYCQDRLGMPAESHSLSVGSPFNYEAQMRVIIPRGLPEPTTEDFPAGAAHAIKHYVRQTQGRTFVLFTSEEMMKKVAHLVIGELTAEGFTLLIQGGGLARNVMLGKFKEEGKNVLFGLESFWTGVDVRGEALSNVIITRLPFSVPDHPLFKARTERINSKGGNAFRDYALPEAILKFRQGVGRLIRTAEDRGIIVILDSRIRSKWYGKFFLNALPECPKEIEQISLATEVPAP